ncbi:NADH dehydrogenase [ubiquinone] 1 beta subcomplex subunit 2, mitochondrial [Pseudolycoriella hygida]|uniref:NADH dehydrogenase [ubiquinone] 1 beta subcomplex subunit 2, mitochondrial n=1 Tax=Pseudolycoriella hygida TaxID=35572 RepID=A0A9Q0RXI6_9DIPT|nr:NADH dehydrogenase [ubiquinone] 1 beta subcomplex subunit 2, mitochondrial [Pseudolycoriella hygida]
MSLARYALLGRNISQLMSKTSTPNNQAITKRLSHVWSYRTGAPPHSKGVIYGSQFFSALMWWWILWHLVTEPEHIYGEFPYPDASAWTNAELGIPPDDEQ